MNSTRYGYSIQQISPISSRFPSLLGGGGMKLSGLRITGWATAEKREEERTRTNNFAVSRANVGRVTSMFYYLIPLNSSRLRHPPASTRRWGIPALISAAKNRASKSPCNIFLYFFAIHFSLNCVLYAFKRGARYPMCLSCAASLFCPFLLDSK